ncbi:hypothetical protein LIER_36530 [Lithospermum erythrorhizon]|uniref:Uncharacterized protein n=1 Tax=Lithospermum erythrorhizon TaxID=34254 RepID=A0AAV3P842_LITER
MAVDVCSDFSHSLVTSPRISFSHDLKESDIVPVECFNAQPDHFLLEQKIDFDFDFCINPSSSSSTISSADELFSNGKILPFQIKKTPPNIKSLSRTSRQNSTPITLSCKIPNCENGGKNNRENHSKCNRGSRLENTYEDANKKLLKDFLTTTVDDEEQDKKTPTKQFWQFRRTSSLNSTNCENGRKNNGIIKSLQFLSRSNSTGSAPCPKTIVQQKVSHKAAIARSISHKEHSIKRTSSQKEVKMLPRSSSVSSSTQYYAFSSGKKASLRKSYSNVIRVDPVLNITPTYFTKGTMKLFGLCSFLSNSKSNKKKK